MTRPYLQHSGFRLDPAHYEDEQQIRTAGRDVVNKARQLRRDGEQLTLFLAEVQAVILRYPKADTVDRIAA